MLDLRLPRALAAFATGGLLALAGTLMQVLMRNPLADPYVLGISGGAAVAALAGDARRTLRRGRDRRRSSARWSRRCSCSGSRATGDAGAPWVATRLLLTGVVVAAGWGALIALLLTLAPDAAVRGMLFWLLGDLSAATRRRTGDRGAGRGARRRAAHRARTQRSSPAAKTRRWHWASRCRRSRWSRTCWRPRQPPSRWRLAGSIGFVGLLAPHALRLVVGNDQRVLLPAATLAGGTLLVVADTLARTLVAPLQLPVGVLTALRRRAGFPVLLARGGAR